MFLGILPTPCLSKPFCVTVCTIIIHIIYERHAEARVRGGGAAGEIVYS